MTYNVTARRWRLGWELDIDGVGVTQSRTLADAEEMVRDYLRLDDHTDWETAAVAIAPKLSDFLEVRVRQARRHVREAEQARHVAAVEARAVARLLREQEGLSVTDTAAVLGVSRGRVSQLVSG